MSRRPPGNSAPVLRRNYRHLAFEHQKVCEGKEAIIKYMKQEFRIVDHLFKRLSEDFKQLSRRCSMQVSGISHS